MSETVVSIAWICTFIFMSPGFSSVLESIRIKTHKINYNICQKLNTMLNTYFFEDMRWDCLIALSNSSIIHDDKTKEITTVNSERFGYVILIIIKCSELLPWISLTVTNALRSYIKYSEECFTRYPNTSKLVKKHSAAPRCFNPPLFGFLTKHSYLCLIYYRNRSDPNQNVLHVKRYYRKSCSDVGVRC